MRIQKGFTVLEVLLTIAALALAASIFIRPFSVFQKEQILRKETDQAASFLLEARTKTIASINNRQYGIHFATGSATLFEGSVFLPDAAENKTHTFDPLIVVGTPFLQGGGQDVVFQKRTGETDFYGTVAFFVSSGAASSTITIQQTGLIESR